MGKGYYSDAFRLDLLPPKENVGTELGKAFMTLGALADENYRRKLKEQQIRNRQAMMQQQLQSMDAWRQSQEEHLQKADELAAKQAEDQHAMNELNMLDRGHLEADRGALSELPNYGSFEEFSKHFSLNTPESLKIAQDYYDKKRTLADKNTAAAIQSQLYRITGGLTPTPEEQRYFNSSDIGQKLWKEHPAAMLAVNDTINAVRLKADSGKTKDKKDPLDDLLLKTMKQLPVDVRGDAAKIYNDPTLSKQEKLSKLSGLGVKAELTVDKRKATQKFAEAVGNLKGLTPLLDRLVTNYKTDYTGFLDTPIHNVAEYIGKADPKLSAYKQDLHKLFILQKQIDNMGANFTKSEQEMLRSTMPDDMKADETYAPQLLNYIRTMRDIVKGRIKAVKGTNYDTGNLENVVKQLDGVLEHAKNNPFLSKYLKDVGLQPQSTEDAWKNARGLDDDATASSSSHSAPATSTGGAAPQPTPQTKTNMPSPPPVGTVIVNPATGEKRRWNGQAWEVVR